MTGLRSAAPGNASHLNCQEKENPRHRGEIVGSREGIPDLLRDKDLRRAPRCQGGTEQHVHFLWDRFYLKLFRNPREGMNPDREIVQFLTEQSRFRPSSFGGCLEYHRPGREPTTIGLLQGFVHCRRCLEVHPRCREPVFRSGPLPEARPSGTSANRPLALRGERSESPPSFQEFIDAITWR